MYLKIWNLFFFFISFIDFYGALEFQASTRFKQSTNKQKAQSVRIFKHIPKFSKHKTEGQLMLCNSTFHLLQYPIYDPQKECEKYSSLVIGFEELIIFINEIRSSSIPPGDMVFLLRNNADQDTIFLVDYSEFHLEYNLDIGRKKTTKFEQNHVVCVKLDCPKYGSVSNPCPSIFLPPAISKENKSYQGSWFKIGLSLIIILVLAIIAVLIYLIASFYPKESKTNGEISIFGKHLKSKFNPCGSFDAYDFLRRMENSHPTLSETYAKPMKFNASQILSDGNNNITRKSNSTLIIEPEKPNEELKDQNYFNPKITDHLELLNNKNKTMPLIKKRYNFDSLRLVPSPEYSLMEQELSHDSSRTNPSFRSVKYIPPVKLVENEF